MNNLYSEIPQNIPSEIFDDILISEKLRIERIISQGQSSEEGFWYDQNENEWIILLRGKAKLLLEGEALARDLHEGDFLNIPAHKKHRIEWTDSKQKNIWLAIFY